MPMPAYSNVLEPSCEVGDAVGCGEAVTTGDGVEAAAVGVGEADAGGW